MNKTNKPNPEINEYWTHSNNNKIIQMTSAKKFMVEPNFKLLEIEHCMKNVIFIKHILNYTL